MAERIFIQRKKGEAAFEPPAHDGDLAGHVRSTVSTGGRPLDQATRVSLEPQFGYDFSQVRVHTGDQAAQSAETLHAQAYTVGQDIVFGEDAYAPQSGAGQRLIAHELAHVVQQSSGPVAGSMMAQGVSISQPSDSFEQAADRAADLAVSGAPAASAAQAPAAGAAPTVQREEDEEEPLPEEQVAEMPENEEELA
jgi:hypothetical protein